MLKAEKQKISCSSYLLSNNTKLSKSCGSLSDFFYKSYTKVNADKDNLSYFYNFISSNISHSTNLSFRSLMRDVNLFIYLTNHYNKSIFQYETILVFLQNIQKALVPRELYNNEETLYIVETFIWNIPYLLPKNDPKTESYISCKKEIEMIIDILSRKVEIYETKNKDKYFVLIEAIKNYFALIGGENRKIEVPELITTNTNLTKIELISGPNETNTFFEEDAVKNFISSDKKIEEQKPEPPKQKIKKKKHYTNNHEIFDTQTVEEIEQNSSKEKKNKNTKKIENINGNSNVIKRYNPQNNIRQVKHKSNKFDSSEILDERRNNISVIILEYYQKHSCDDFVFDSSTFKDSSFTIHKIGSYTLNLMKSSNSMLDLVFLPNSFSHFEPLSKEEIKIWINERNFHSKYFLEIDESDETESKLSNDIMYYNLCNSKMIVVKQANLYIFNEKLVFCNQILNEIFKDESGVNLLHSFYLEFMKKFGYINGSELCFLIVAFLDYKFYIFDKNNKITKEFYIYKKQALTKELLFYYPFNDDNLELINKSKEIFELIAEFNDFILDLLNNNFETPKYWNDKSYLFQIKIFFKIASKNNEASKKIFQSIKDILYSSVRFVYPSFEDFLLKTRKLINI